jgi:hypothetical protein
MKRKYLVPVALGLLTLTAIITNPQPERHKEAVRNKLNSALQTTMKEKMDDSDDNWEKAGTALGMMLGGTLIDQMINRMVTTNNYVFFSTTKVNWEGQSKTIGFGIFGNVYITTQLDDALNNGLLKTEIEN